MVTGVVVCDADVLEHAKVGSEGDGEEEEDWGEEEVRSSLVHFDFGRIAMNK